MFDLTTMQWTLLLLSGVCIGVSKAGFSGVSMLSVAMLAEAFGARESIGVNLPMLIAADIIVYPAFRKWGSWREVTPLLITMLIGVGLGFWWLMEIPDTVLRPVIGWIIVVMLGFQLWKRLSATTFRRVAESPVFGAGAGVIGGVATTMANAAGPVMQLFLLSRGLPKMEMVGIGARLFLVVNLVKVPLLGKVDLITTQSLALNALGLPFIIFGIWWGKRYLLRIPQRVFEWMIIVFAFGAAVRLLVF